MRTFKLELRMEPADLAGVTGENSVNCGASLVENCTRTSGLAAHIDGSAADSTWRGGLRESRADLGVSSEPASAPWCSLEDTSHLRL
jgi:hypothetical protein